MTLAFKSEKCIGCKLCQLACSAYQEQEFNPYRARLFVKSTYAGKDLVVEGRVCTLCGVCVEVCPSGAMTMQEGRLFYDPEVCISCYSCADSCPEEVITRRDVGVAVCNLCGGAPRCVRWCPHEAVVFEEEGA